MDEVGDRLVAECEDLSDRLNRVLDKQPRYKKAYAQSQDKFRRSVEHLGELQVDLRREQANVADQSSKRARLRRVLLDRKSVLTHLCVEVSNLTAKKYRAVEDHLALRDRLASLVTRNHVPISTPVAPIDPFLGLPILPIAI